MSNTRPGIEGVGSADAGIARLNAMAAGSAIDALLACCGSRRWAEGMEQSRPFADEQSLLDTSERIWRGLSRQDWLEAFSQHPRIGERNLHQPRFAAASAAAGREQSGMASATDAERAEFAAFNGEYERRFGHVFLICATGKSSSQMLEQLRARIHNSAEAELANAAREQNAITRLRLERWTRT